MSNSPLIRSTVFIFLVVSASFSTTAQALEDLLHYVFVVNQGSSEIVVVDTDDDTVADRIQLSSVSDEVMLSEESRKLLSSNLANKTVTITSLDSLKQERVITLDFPPTRMRLGSEGRLLVVGNSDVGAVSIIDLVTGQETRIEGLDSPDYFIFGRNQQFLYVASANAARLAVVDIKSGNVRKTIPLLQDEVGKEGKSVVSALARTPGGQLGFVLRTDEAVMDVIDLRENTRIKSVELSGSVDRVYPSANNQYLIVPDNDSGDVSVFSTWSLRKVGTVSGAQNAAAVSIALFDSVAFVVSRKRQSALAFGISDRAQLADIPLPGAPEDSVVSVDGLKVYVALPDSRQLAVIDAIKLEIIGLIDNVGDRPVDVITVRDLSYCH